MTTQKAMSAFVNASCTNVETTFVSIYYVNIQTPSALMYSKRAAPMVKTSGTRPKKDYDCVLQIPQHYNRHKLKYRRYIEPIKQAYQEYKKTHFAYIWRLFCHLWLAGEHRSHFILWEPLAIVLSAFNFTRIKVGLEKQVDTFLLYA